MNLSIEEQRWWALGSTLVIIVVAVMALYEPTNAGTGPSGASFADSGATEVVLTALHVGVPALAKLVDG